jgi:Ca-activated chloride channel family protein
MVAIYPKEGTIWHNNPGGVLENVEWSTPEQQEAARLFIDYLLEPEQQQKAMEWGMRPGNPSLGPGPFINAEYGIDPAKPTKLLGAVKPAVAEEILNSWSEVKKPGVIVLVLDTSGSMQGEKIDQAKQGALRFLDTVSVNNHVGMLTFATNVGTVVDVGPIEKKKFDIAGAIESARAGGDTALYDAVRRGVEMADAYPLQGAAIRGVIVLSDGVRTSGRVRLSDLIELRTSNEQAVPVFVGGERDDKRDIHGAGLAFPTQNSIHIFSIAYGKDADLEVLRIFSEATNSTFNKATEKNIIDVLEVFSKYF